MQSLFVTAALVALSGLACTAISCTAISKVGTTQCRSEADCLGLGPGFANMTCNEERVCVAVPTPPNACNTNQECIERNFNQPYRCLPEKTCAPLTSIECPRILGETPDLLDDNAIYFGVISPANTDGLNIIAGADLARAEIRVNLGGGVPTPSGKIRPIVGISCLAEASPTVPQNGIRTTLLAGRHLIDVAKVGAVVGPLITSDLITVANQVSIPALTSLVMTEANIDIVSDLPSKDSLFRFSATQSQIMGAMAPFMADYLEGRAVTDGLVMPGEDLRVEVVYSTDQTGVGPLNYLLQHFTFNKGKTIEQNGANWRTVDHGDPNNSVTTPDLALRKLKAVADVLAFKPHVVIHAAGPGNVSTVYLPIEKQWPAGVPRPYHLAVIEAWQSFFVPAIGSNDSLRKRSFGFTGVPEGYDPVVAEQFNVSLRANSPEVQSAISSYAADAYDSIYMYALAAGSLGDQPVTLEGLIKGMRAASTGTDPLTPITGANLAKAISTLASGGRITAVGASGTIQFDAKRNRPANSTLYCVGADANGVANAIVRPGYHIDGMTGKATGSPVCP